MINRVTAKVDRRNLKFEPTLDGSEASATSDSAFKVTVINESERFASFQVKLLVPGIDSDEIAAWYKIEPEFATKKPPGASTLFDIAITRSPLPVYDKPIDLLLEVFSVEYSDLRTQQGLSLVVQEPSEPLQLVLPNSLLRGVPGDRIEIPVLLYNTSRSAETRQLRCQGIDPAWFAERSATQKVTAEPGYPARAAFQIGIPLDLEFPIEPLKFTIEVTTTALSHRTSPPAEGILEIVPPGIVEFDCPEKHQRIPSRRFALFRSPPATFPIDLKNTSNTPQRVKLMATQAKLLKLQLPDPVSLNPTQKRSVPLISNLKRHWFGGRKRHSFTVDADVRDLKSDDLSPTVRAVPPRQQFELEVLPIISPFLLIASGALLLALLWLYWLLNPKPHHYARVNSVQLDGDAGTVFSASSDRQILRWQVRDSPFQVAARRLQFMDRVNPDSTENRVDDPTGEPDRAVRVVRLKPENNNVMAAGLENGTIQLWDVLGNTKQKTPFSDNDRVFDLDFTPDSRYLFSGHGSGQIRQWDVNSGSPKLVQTILLSPTSFSIAALSVYQPNPENSLVAIAGQYNKLLLWDWKVGTVYDIPYGLSQNPQSLAVQSIQGQYHYIDSLAVANDLLITADNDGLTTIWDLSQRKCQPSLLPQNPSTKTPQVIQKKPGNTSGNASSNTPNKISKLTWGQCQIPILDQWADGHGGKAVRAIAITSDAAYLASAGDDGRVKLWFLKKGKRQQENGQIKPAKVLADYEIGVHSVDIEVSRIAKFIFVTSDAPQNQVKLYREPLSDANQ